MKIDVSVSINAQQPVEVAVQQCWAAMFQPPKYNGEKGGPGWEVVRHQVLRYVESLDLEAEITRVAQARLPTLVDETVSALLAAAIRKKAKAMQDTGQMTLGGMPSGVNQLLPHKP